MTCCCSRRAGSVGVPGSAGAWRSPAEAGTPTEASDGATICYSEGRPRPTACAYALTVRLHFAARHVQLPAGRNVVAHLRDRRAHDRGRVPDAAHERVAAVRVLAVQAGVPGLH